MKKIVNPWKGLEEYRCFGCSPDNRSGLRMEFYEDGDEVVSSWKPRPEFQGWINTLHGGIQAALADEISSWVIFRKYQTSGVTSRMEIRYIRPVSTEEDRVLLRARVVRERRNIVDIKVEIFNSREELCSEAVCVYYTFPREKAMKEFHFMECGVED